MAKRLKEAKLAIKQKDFEAAESACNVLLSLYLHPSSIATHRPSMKSREFGCAHFARNPFRTTPPHHCIDLQTSQTFQAKAPTPPHGTHRRLVCDSHWHMPAGCVGFTACSPGCDQGRWEVVQRSRIPGSGLLQDKPACKWSHSPLPLHSSIDHTTPSIIPVSNCDNGVPVAPSVRVFVVCSGRLSSKCVMSRQ
jgi:hypothetical protein